MWNLSLEERDGTGASLWKVSLGALARGSLSFAVGAGGEVFVAVAGKIATANGILAGPGDPLAEGALFKVAPDGTLAWGQQLVEATAQSVLNNYNAGLQQSAVAIERCRQHLGRRDCLRGRCLPGQRDIGRGGGGRKARRHGRPCFCYRRPSWAGQSRRRRSPMTILLSVAPDGGVVFAGAVPWAIDLGGGSLVPAAPGGPGDTFVARLDATGAHVWSAMFGDRNGSQPHGLALDAQGNVVIAGAFAGLLPIGGDLLSFTGDLDVFVARLGPDGVPAGQKTGGDAGD